jgi:transcription factor C subunit 7
MSSSLSSTPFKYHLKKRCTDSLSLNQQFRSNWNVDNDTGVYTAHLPSPTGIPSDPALSSYGVTQSKQLAKHLVTLDPPIEVFYSSPFYRCIQTIDPTLALAEEINPDAPKSLIRGDKGIGEWYGLARFDHPSPATPQLLKSLWPRYDVDYQPTIVPSVNGESVDDLHDRTAYSLHRIIEKSDKEGVKAIIICSHAATILAIGRALTGKMPEDITEQDFNPFTCGLSKFVRKRKDAKVEEVPLWEAPAGKIPRVDWREGKGVYGGWNCELNGDCSFLSGGEERGW